MTQGSPPQNTNSKKTNWFLILTIISTILTGVGVVVAVPEFRCFLLRSTCPPPIEPLTRKEVELFTQTETGELLGGVQITVIGSGGPPEVAQTDDNGYARVNIPSKGDVLVNLTKSGYPTQNFTINLENEQKLVRIIQMNQAGKPEVIASLTPPPTPTSTPTTPTSTTTPATRTDPNSVVTAVENDFMKMEMTGINRSENGEINMAFMITNKTSDNLYLSLYWLTGNYGATITDNFGQVCTGKRLTGLQTAGINDQNPNNFTLISPKSFITVSLQECSFPKSTKLNASFPLIRHQPSSTSSGGENTRFSAGFTGLTIPEN